MEILEVLPGSEIHTVIADAIRRAEKIGDQCQFDFNGVTIIVDSDSDPELIHRDWCRALYGYLGKSPSVGPFPSVQLSSEEIERDREVEERNQKRREDRQAEYAKEQRQKELVLNSELLAAGRLEIRDQESWNKVVKVNTSPYGKRTVTFAEQWGRLMQVRIAKGETVAECADECSHMADTDGITGFMYGAAKAILVKCWKYGDGL